MRVILVGMMVALLFVGVVPSTQVLEAFLDKDERVQLFSVQEPGNVPPVVEVMSDVSSGKAPLVVHFDGEVWDTDGEIYSLEWDFEGDGSFEISRSVKDLKGTLKAAALKSELRREHTFVKPGIFHVLVRVTDDKGGNTVSSVTIQVFSDRPFLDIVPCNEEFEFVAKAGYEAFFKSEVDTVKFQMVIPGFRTTWGIRSSVRSTGRKV